MSTTKKNDGLKSLSMRRLTKETKMLYETIFTENMEFVMSSETSNKWYFIVKLTEKESEIYQGTFYFEFVFENDCPLKTFQIFLCRIFQLGERIVEYA